MVAVSGHEKPTNNPVPFPPIAPRETCHLQFLGRMADTRKRRSVGSEPRGSTRDRALVGIGSLPGRAPSRCVRAAWFLANYRDRRYLFSKLPWIDMSMSTGRAARPHSRRNRGENCVSRSIRSGAAPVKRSVDRNTPTQVAQRLQW